MNIIERLNEKGDKITFYYDYGRGPGQRPSTGIFIYKKPKNQIEKNHNKEALALLETKKSQQIIEQQAIGSAFIPTHKFKANFFDYYEEYAKLNQRKGNRHIQSSLTQFKLFTGKEFISPVDITENLCKRFRQYLLDKFNGETPLNYYSRFKMAIRAATKDKYFAVNPTEDLPSKSNPSTTLKENLEVEEYLQLLNTPYQNEEVRAAFIFCCYTALRWVDVKRLEWSDIKGNILTTRIIQAKTGRPVTLTLHPIAVAILEKQFAKSQASAEPEKYVFILPTADGANKILDTWMKAAKIEKQITWSCRSLDALLKQKPVNFSCLA